VNNDLFFGLSRVLSGSWPFDTAETIVIVCLIPFAVREIFTPWSRQ
jgi:hypothetical protein